MSQQVSTIISSKLKGSREWYENDTISVDRNGINGTITELGTGSFNDTTIMVDKTGILGTTIDI